MHHNYDTIRKKRLCLLLLLIIGGIISGCTMVISTKPPTTPTAKKVQALSNGPYAALTIPPTQPPTTTQTATPVPATSTPTPTDTAVSTATVLLPTTTETPTLIPTITPTVTEVGAEVATPTETPTLIPIPPTPVSPTVVPPTTVPPESTGLVSIRETTLSINTFDYESALIPTSPDDLVYPYPRLDHNQVGPPTPQNHRAIILENPYTQLVVLPDLGGRIYRWIDKTSGKNLFYENPVIKPTQWGYRGWWLATGGMEWALPLDEHGLSEASPWSYTLYQSDQSVSVILSDTEEQTGLVSEITLSLDASHAYFTLTPRILNPTAGPVPFKFWLNGMFGLGSPQPGANVDFILPGNRVTVHSTGDLELPGEKSVIDWPITHGRDLSNYGNWTNYLGVFAAPAAQDSFMGAYNRETELGVARIFPHQLVQGAKIFGPSNLDPGLWTTDKSTYFELWGGLAPTFWDTFTLEPEGWITWQERWYALSAVGGFQVANEEAALNLRAKGGVLEIAAASTYALNGELLLWQAGTVINRWPLSLSPRNPFRTDFTPANNQGPWGLSLVDSTGRELIATGDTQANSPVVATHTPLPQPTSTPIPQPTETPTAEPTPTVAPTEAPTAEPTPAPVQTNAQAEPGQAARANTSLVWDPRLEELGVTLIETRPTPGQPIYRLIEARYQDDRESNLLHHIFVEVLDESGQRIVGQSVTVGWDNGQTTLITEDKPHPEYATNFPMFSAVEQGRYYVYIDNAPSDVVQGMGLPANHHVNYLLTFQRSQN